MRRIDTDGKATVYKDQFVAKQFREIQRIDHNEIMSQVAMPKSI
jgi:hypothetical protein